MHENLLYNIRNMRCSYAKEDNEDSVVLWIDSLQIPSGVITFFVGPSGVGKSTILETLGVMNNTIQSVDTFEYKGRDLSSAWTWHDSELSKFRNDEFSFVFQETNLMPNFSALENVMTTGLFQGMDATVAQNESLQLLIKLGVEIYEDRSIDKFSGGQRQRIAFARAMLPKFNVLFGDEPTGNLDSKTADDLMTLLKSELLARNASAIIVSHDMAIATKYADIIIHINKIIKDNNTSYGYIDESCVYKKFGKRWSNIIGLLTSDDIVNRIWK